MASIFHQQQWHSTGKQRGQATERSNSGALFQKGVAISVWQNSCDTHSQWTAFMKQRNYFGQQQHVEALSCLKRFLEQVRASEGQ